MTLDDQLARAQALPLSQAAQAASAAQTVYVQAHALGKHTLAAEAALLAARAHNNRDEYAQALNWAMLSEASAQVAGVLRLRALALAVIAAIHAKENRAAPALAAADAAMLILPAHVEPRDLHTVHTAVGMTFGALGLPHLALAAYKRALDVMQQQLQGDARGQALSHLNLMKERLHACDLLLLTDPRAAAELIAEMRSAARALLRAAINANDSSTTLLAEYLVAKVDLLVGDARTAHARLVRVAGGLSGIQASLWVDAMVNLARACRALGDSDGSQRALDAAWERRAELAGADGLGLLSRLCEMRGDTAAAMQHHQQMHARRMRVVQEILDVRVGEIHHHVETQTLRQEGTEPRERRDNGGAEAIPK